MAKSKIGTQVSASGNIAPETKRLLTIEQHAERRATDPAVFAGVMGHNGWAAGKQVSKADYDDGVTAFLAAAGAGSAKDGD